MTENQWIWIPRWKDFQHYPPERDRGPAWIKDYPKQLQDERYLELSANDRGTLAGLRLAFAQARFELPAETRQLTRRLAVRVTPKALNSLSDAGFIELVSRATLDRRIEEVYASRAPARSRRRETSKEVSLRERDSRAAAKSGTAAPAESDKAYKRAEQWIENVGTTELAGLSDEHLRYVFEGEFKITDADVIGALVRRVREAHLADLAERQYEDELEAVSEEVDF